MPQHATATESDLNNLQALERVAGCQNRFQPKQIPSLPWLNLQGDNQSCFSSWWRRLARNECLLYTTVFPRIRFFCKVVIKLLILFDFIAKCFYLISQTFKSSELYKTNNTLRLRQLYYEPRQKQQHSYNYFVSLFRQGLEICVRLTLLCW